MSLDNSQKAIGIEYRRYEKKIKTSGMMENKY